MRCCRALRRSKGAGVTHPNQVQLVIGCIFGGMAVGRLIAGPLSDAMGRKPVLYIGIVLYLIGSVFCYFVNDFNHCWSVGDPGAGRYRAPCDGGFRGAR